LQTKRGLKHKITRVWDKLITGKKSTTKTFAKAQHRCEEVERELSDKDKDRSTEDIQHQMLRLQASVDAVTVQMKAAETRASASAEREAALESQLYKKQVNWKLRIGLMHL
jgi:hypothetical protein